MLSPSALFVEGERTGKFRLGAVEAWPIVASKGRRFVQSCIEIDIPVIAAVNGPIPVHSEVALLAGVVIAEDRAWFQDPHMLGVSLREMESMRYGPSFSAQIEPAQRCFSRKEDSPRAWHMAGH
jgi:hypothetical protein